MLLTVFCLRRDRSELTFSLQVDADFELQNFRALCELESGIPAAESQIVYAERPLTDNHRSLASYGLKDGDVVILQQMENPEVRGPVQFPGLPRIDFSSITVPGTSAQPPKLPAQQPATAPRPSPPELPSSPQSLDNPALLRDMLLANPHELSLLKERNPPLAEALLSGDIEKFTRVLVEQQQDRARREQERIRLFSADPFDLEAQAKIEEDIRQQNIEENMTIAMEEAPESFGQVVMLYINCKVNGHPVKAFVDSGAQMTIMSQACAERCNIMRLVDRRWAGIAKGVGTQKIIGRVHLAQVQIEGDFLPCSFSILEEQPMDMLLGLDMLKRHQCSIDLKKNVLVIGTTGSQTTFLPEGELPECARLAYGAGREDVRPEEIADQELAEALQKSVEEAENSNKATTSLETPSVPTLDGIRGPVRFPEISLKTSDPASRLLDRSASAPSVCTYEGSQAEPANPRRAAQSVESLLERPGTSGSKETPLSPLNLPAHAISASADTEKSRMDFYPGPAVNSQNTFARPAPQGYPQEPSAKDGAQGLELPAESRGRCSLSAHRRAEDTDVRLFPGCLEWEQRRELHLELKAWGKSERELLREDQNEAEEQEVLFSPLSRSSTLASGAESPADSVFARRKSAERELAFLSEGTCRLACKPSKHLGGEVFMEVDFPGESGHTAGDPLSKGSSGQASASPKCSMTKELPPKGPRTLPASSSPGSASLDTPAVASHPLGPGGQQADDPSLSLTSALKELHQLLVVSCKGDLKISQHDEKEQLVAISAEQSVTQEMFEEEPICQCPGSREVTCSSEASSPSMPAAEGHEVPRAAGRKEPAPLATQESSNLGGQVFRHPLTASRPLQDDQCLPMLVQPFSSDQVQGDDDGVLKQHRLPSSGLTHGQTPGSCPNGTGMPSAAEANAQSSLVGLTQPSPAPSLGLPAPAAPRHLVSSTADIDPIVGAGFTPQEAGEALEQAGGNPDLALLILLAKNIIVPT